MIAMLIKGNTRLSRRKRTSWTTSKTHYDTFLMNCVLIHVFFFFWTGTPGATRTSRPAWYPRRQGASWILRPSGEGWRERRSGTYTQDFINNAFSIISILLQGPDGHPGIPGHIGIIGPRGFQGPAGLPGADGRDGRQVSLLTSYSLNILLRNDG